MTWYETQYGKNEELRFIKGSLGKTTCHFIGEGLRPLFIQAITAYFQLRNAPRHPLDDYDSRYENSHLVFMPLSIALEKVLFKLADELNLSYRKSATIGAVFDRAQVAKLVVGLGDGKQGRVVEEQLAFIGGFIQEYRNNPIHGDIKIESDRQLQNKIGAVLDRLRSLIEAFDRVGLIEVPEFKYPAIGERSNWG